MNDILCIAIIAMIITPGIIYIYYQLQQQETNETPSIETTMTQCPQCNAYKITNTCPYCKHKP